MYYSMLRTRAVVQPLPFAGGGHLLRGVTLTGNAFEVLESIDAISQEFTWDLGSGHCGKGQPAKVDAGGPYVRCEVLLGGEQG